MCPGDAVALELAAAEMAQSAAEFVALEKEMDKLKAKGADSAIIALKDTARYAPTPQQAQLVQPPWVCLPDTATACS